MIYIGILIVVVVGPPQSDHAKDAPEVEMVEPDGTDGSTYGYCKECGWRKSYPDETRAKKALGAHQRFCRGRSWRVSPFARPFRP